MPMAGYLRNLLIRSYGVSRVLVSSGARQLSVSAVAMATEGSRQFETLEVTRPSEWVIQVQLDRPEKSNAMNIAFFRELQECFDRLSDDSQCRCVLLTGAGKNFTAGLDLQNAAGLFDEGTDVVNSMQDSFTAIEKCQKPVIAAIHAACVGGGVDLTTACDIRLCTSDAWFSVKEVNESLVADISTLERLLKVVGSESLVRELVYTGRKLMAREALIVGLVSKVYTDREGMLADALKLAETIASKSPVAIQATKVIFHYRDFMARQYYVRVPLWLGVLLLSYLIYIISTYM